jgi:anti-sigma B factor antagonist
VRTGRPLRARGDVALPRDGHRRADDRPLSGEVDVFTAGSLRQAIDGARHRHRSDVDVVAGDVTFMDSSALHVLVHAQRTLRTEGRILRLVEPSEVVRRLVQLSGAERLYGEPAPA